MENPDRKTKEQRVTFELVLGQLRQHNFAVLSTADEDGSPHSAGVNYGVSKGDGGLALPPDMANVRSFSFYDPLFVPEPSTFALLGFGALGLWIFRRKNPAT